MWYVILSSTNCLHIVQAVSLEQALHKAACSSGTELFTGEYKQALEVFSKLSAAL